MKVLSVLFLLFSVAFAKESGHHGVQKVQKLLQDLLTKAKDNALEQDQHHGEFTQRIDALIADYTSERDAAKAENEKQSTREADQAQKQKTAEGEAQAAKEAIANHKANIDRLEADIKEKTRVFNNRKADLDDAISGTEQAHQFITSGKDSAGTGPVPTMLTELKASLTKKLSNLTTDFDALDRSLHGELAAEEKGLSNERQNFQLATSAAANASEDRGKAKLAAHDEKMRYEENVELLASAELRKQQKDAEHKQRSTLMADEITAITEAMEAMKGTTGVSFLQVSQSALGYNPVGLKALFETAKRLKSANMYTVALEISQNRAHPFDKVKRMIQKMIEKLNKEQAEEEARYGGCKKALEEKQADLKTSTEDHESDLADVKKLDAAVFTTTNDLAENEKKFKDNAAARDDARAEHEDNVKTSDKLLKESKETRDALQAAIKILKDFYNNTSVVGEQADAGKDLTKVDEDTSGDATLQRKGHYDGEQQQSGNIINLMQQLYEDNVKLFDETEHEAKEELREYNEDARNFSMMNKKYEKRIDYLSAKLIQLKTDLGSAEDSRDTNKNLKDSTQEEVTKMTRECLGKDLTAEDLKEKMKKRHDAMKEEIRGLEEAIKHLQPTTP